MEFNILQGGLKEIEEAKQLIVELNKHKDIESELQAHEKQIESSISKKEKDIADEINKVTNQRLEQLKSTFDEQLKSVDEKLTSLESKKEKAKKKAMIQRIDFETSDFRSEDEELQLNAKSAFKEEKIPSLYNNRLFFALYFPSGLGDFGIILLTLALTFFVVPFGIYSLFFEGMGSLYLAFSYIGVILIFGGIYLKVSKTKYNHLEALNKVKEMRIKIKENKKKERKIKRKIKKDTDESPYDLNEFDKEIEEYKGSRAELLEKKTAALLEFDTNTAKEINRQITEAHDDESNSLKDQYQKIYNDRKENLERLNELSLKLSTNYESIMGKEFLQIEKLDSMAKAIKDGDAKNIEEALDFISHEN